LRVKVCGITSLEDALESIKSGADAIGFVFYEKSPRYIEPSKARDIIDSLPPFIEKVGLFVNHSPSEINKIFKNTKITLAQIHFDIDSELLQFIEVPYLRVIRAKNKDDVLSFNDKYRLIDAFVDSYGGAGARLNLDWFKDIDCSKIILAGGLSCENIDELKGFNFYGVDASSSLEISKGKKDKERVKKFIQKVKDISAKL
jgi:phosphoribosylanthranilate isomerase